MKECSAAWRELSDHEKDAYSSSSVPTKKSGDGAAATQKVPSVVTQHPSTDAKRPADFKDDQSIIAGVVAALREILEAGSHEDSWRLAAIMRVVRELGDIADRDRAYRAATRRETPEDMRRGVNGVDAVSVHQKVGPSTEPIPHVSSSVGVGRKVQTDPHSHAHVGQISHMNTRKKHEGGAATTIHKVDKKQRSEPMTRPSLVDAISVVIERLEAHPDARLAEDVVHRLDDLRVTALKRHPDDMWGLWQEAGSIIHTLPPSAKLSHITHYLTSKIPARKAL